MISFLLKWFVKQPIWIWTSRKIIARLTFRLFGYPSFDIEKYFQIRDIILQDSNSIYCFVGADKCSASWKLNNLITKCEFGHAGFVFERDGELTIAHFMGNGLVVESALRYLKEIDVFKVVKLSFKSKEKFSTAKNRVGRIISNKEKVQYDFLFNIDDTEDFSKLLDSDSNIEKIYKIYCSEFIYIVNYGLLDDDDFRAYEKMDKIVFEPDQVAKLGEVVF